MKEAQKGCLWNEFIGSLYNPDLYLTAYGKLYRNKGAMTEGATEETVEGMSLDKIETHHQSVARWNVSMETCATGVYPEERRENAPVGTT